MTIHAQTHRHGVYPSLPSNESPHGSIVRKRNQNHVQYIERLVLDLGLGLASKPIATLIIKSISAIPATIFTITIIITIIIAIINIWHRQQRRIPKRGSRRRHAALEAGVQPQRVPAGAGADPYALLSLAVHEEAVGARRAVLDRVRRETEHGSVRVTVGRWLQRGNTEIKLNVRKANNKIRYS